MTSCSSSSCYHPYTAPFVILILFSLPVVLLLCCCRSLKRRYKNELQQNEYVTFEKSPSSVLPTGANLSHTKCDKKNSEIDHHTMDLRIRNADLTRLLLNKYDTRISSLRRRIIRKDDALEQKNDEIIFLKEHNDFLKKRIDFLEKNVNDYSCLPGDSWPKDLKRKNGETEAGCENTQKKTKTQEKKSEENEAERMIDLKDPSDGNAEKTEEKDENTEDFLQPKSIESIGSVRHVEMEESCDTMDFDSQDEVETSCDLMCSESIENRENSEKHCHYELVESDKELNNNIETSGKTTLDAKNMNATETSVNDDTVDILVTIEVEEEPKCCEATFETNVSDTDKPSKKQKL